MTSTPQIELTRSTETKRGEPPSAPEPRPPRRSWAPPVAAALGVLFLLLGASKLLGVPMMERLFVEWGYPVWFVYVIGAIEMTGGGMLLTTRYRRLGAMSIFVVMVGAIATHLRADEWTVALIPTIVLGLTIALLVEIGRKPQGELPPLN